MTGEKFTLKGHSFHKVLLLIKAKQKSKKNIWFELVTLKFKSLIKNEIKFFLFSTFTFA